MPEQCCVHAEMNHLKQRHSGIKSGRRRIIAYAFIVLIVPGFLSGETNPDGAHAFKDKSGSKGYTLVHVLPRTAGYVNGMACSSDGSLLAVASDDGRVTLWNTGSGALVRVIDGREGAVYAVAISPDDLSVATAGFDGTIRVWGLSSGRLQHALSGHRGWINSVAYMNGGRTLISGGRDRTVRVWDVQSGRMLRVIDYPSEVFTVAADPRGEFFASDKGNSFSIRELTKGHEIAGGASGQWGINALVFSPGRPLLMSGGYDGVLWVWNIAEAKLERRIEIQGSPIISLATTKDGTLMFALCTGNGTVALYDPFTWHEVARLRAVTYPVGSVVVSADGRILAAGGGDSPIRVWRRSTAR